MLINLRWDIKSYGSCQVVISNIQVKRHKDTDWHSIKFWQLRTHILATPLPLGAEVLLQERPPWYYCTDPVVYISHHCSGTQGDKILIIVQSSQTYIQPAIFSHTHTHLTIYPPWWTALHVQGMLLAFLHFRLPVSCMNHAYAGP